MNSGVLRTAYQIAHPNTEVPKGVDVGGVCSKANFIYCPQNSPRTLPRTPERISYTVPRTPHILSPELLLSPELPVPRTPELPAPALLTPPALLYPGSCGSDPHHRSWFHRVNARCLPAETGARRRSVRTPEAAFARTDRQEKAAGASWHG